MPFPGGEGGPQGRMRDGVHWKYGASLQQMRKRKISARIPHQS